MNASDFGVINRPGSEKSLLQMVANWHTTKLLTLSADVSLESATYRGLSDSTGIYDLFCLAVEDAAASGKKIKFLIHDQADNATPQYWNGANGAVSPKQPPIRTLIYDAAEATTVRAYFQKVYR